MRSSRACRCWRPSSPSSAAGREEYEPSTCVYIPSYDALHKSPAARSASSCSPAGRQGHQGLDYWDNGFKIMSATGAESSGRLSGSQRRIQPPGFGGADGSAGACESNAFGSLSALHPPVAATR